MKIPRATYRLQFRNGIDFESVAGLAPYLQWLGISHLYASPIYAAVTGSNHGYDVVDHNLIDPVLGGRAGFERMVEALRREGIGVLLDIVPNHMAASIENPWWRSVVRLGRESPFAGHFDIDWSRRLTLPILGGSFEDAVEAGDVALVIEADGIGMRVPGAILPLNPTTFTLALEQTPADMLTSKIGRSGLTTNEVDTLRSALDAQSQRRALLSRLHDAQSWQLMNWKTAKDSLSYRRFFEVAGLVGVRVEDPNVFADVHRLTLELVREGLVAGLRIDHVDGLSDPAGYLENLRAVVGLDVYVVVEKILGHGEDLPGWDVQGTTGYEFITAVAGLMVDREGFEHLRQGYASWIGRVPDPDAELRQAKLQLLAVNFSGELEQLAKLSGIPAGTEAIAELIAGFDVYRTYGQDGSLDESDGSRLTSATTRALQRRPDLASGIEEAARLLAEPPSGENARAYRRKFQQLSGPAMAKSLEDTFFYRYHPLIALNEVGSELRGPEGFHAAMAHRLATQPCGLTATATHDTKRGEDARARLYALSHEPAPWLEAVARWHDMMKPDSVDRDTEWMIYQALAGVWPDELALDDVHGLAALHERILPFVEKALREAKLGTDWMEPNSSFEEAHRSFAAALLDPSNQAFLQDFQAVIIPYARAGRLLSNAQLALKLYAPGVPDIYQGTEHEDFSLVDPDNRRRPDLEALAEASRTRPMVKQAIIREALDLRRHQPELFASGTYESIDLPHPIDEAVSGLTRRSADGGVTLLILRRPMKLDGLDRGAVTSATGLTEAELGFLEEHGYLLLGGGR
jgi:(1->4)-alpha-D-glucan 1-alpha-D-glucosylmutase